MQIVKKKDIDCLIKTLVISGLIAILFYASLKYTILAPTLIIPVLFVSAWIIVHFNLQNTFIKTLAFLLPFSLYLPFIGESMIRLPTEPLIILAAIILLIEIAGSPLQSINNQLHKEFLWLAPLALAFVVTTPFSELILVSVKFTLINLLYILVFFVFLARLLKNNDKLFIEMIALYSAGILMVMIWGLYRFWQMEWNTVVIRGVFHPFYNDHTIFGAAAAFLAALWYSTLYMAKNNSSRIIWVSVGLVLTAGVMMSFSRAAFLSLIVYIMVLLMLYFKLRVKHLIALAGGLAILLLLFQEPVRNRLQSIDSVSHAHNSGLADRTRSAGNITTDVSNIERLNRWMAAWNMFMEKPLTGFGPGTYQFTYIPYQEEALMNRLSLINPWDVPEGSGGTAHSEYLLAASEMGVLGLAGWLIFLGRLIYIAFNASTGHPNRKMIIAAFGGLATYLFHAHFNNFLNTDKFAFLFWGTAAWLIASYHSKDRTSPRSIAN